MLDGSTQTAESFGVRKRRSEKGDNKKWVVTSQGHNVRGN